MVSIQKAMPEDAPVIADIGAVSFIESHGSSAAPEEINKYVDEKYNTAVIKQELSDAKNIYHIISYNKQAAGYSKIVFDAPHKIIPQKNITKLERLYLLKEFYDLKLGKELFDFNVALSKNNNQAGMWLFAWKKNDRAVAFYEKAGFQIIGHGDFKLTPTHSNPNYLMLLEY